MKHAPSFTFLLAVAGAQLGCAAEDSAAVAGPDEASQTLSLAEQYEGQYNGTWTIEITPDIGVSGTCAGHVIIRPESIKERLSGSDFTGTYFIDAAGDCASGSTVTGEVINGTIREDGGVNFGLDVPRSDGNFFEDVLAGSGVNVSPIQALGCTLDVADVNNHLDGSIVDARLRAANSAQLSCAQAVIIRGAVPDTTNVITMRVTVDATR